MGFWISDKSYLLHIMQQHILPFEVSEAESCAGGPSRSKSLAAIDHENMNRGHEKSDTRMQLESGRSSPLVILRISRKIKVATQALQTFAITCTAKK
ncbi:hypothetical protein MUK42_15764 [Musa troglodytarum]|uniref:Uncharacterized protein n=1 Tax=Musa troglodytarum TaxID=320322 RepID=A0A9E7KPW7_9LILI|nr:hypothetical protein MUK42_15764 [Musa troglodytarum]